MENYKEAGWSAMSGLENDLKQLEAHLDEHFGDADSGMLGSPASLLTQM